MPLSGYTFLKKRKEKNKKKNKYGQESNYHRQSNLRFEV